MANEVFYPSLSTLFPADDLPENLGFLQDFVNKVFDDIFYRNFPPLSVGIVIKTFSKVQNFGKGRIQLWTIISKLISGFNTLKTA